jgi:hypothetical protein
MKESKIQQQIISYLSHIAIQNNIVFFAIPNESFMMTAKMARMPEKQMAILNTHLHKMGMVSGIPDLCLLYNGEAYFLEVKNEVGKLSATQKLIHKAFKRCGFTVYVVRSVEDVESILNDILGD